MLFRLKCVYVVFKGGNILAIMLEGYFKHLHRRINHFVLQLWGHTTNEE